MQGEMIVRPLGFLVLLAACLLPHLCGAEAEGQLAFTDAPPAFTNATLATFSFSWDSESGTHTSDDLPLTQSERGDSMHLQLKGLIGPQAG